MSGPSRRHSPSSSRSTKVMQWGLPTDAAVRVDREGRLLRTAVVPEILREDAEPIPGLLRLAAVRVEDAQSEIGALRGNEQEDAVRADAPVPVAHAADGPGRERSAEILLVDHDIVVAETVALREGDHGRGSSTRRPVAAETYPV